MWDNKKICLRFQHGLALGLWSKNCPYRYYCYKSIITYNVKKKYKENIIKIKEWEVIVNVDDKEENFNK